MSVMLVKRNEFLEGIRYKLMDYKKNTSELAMCPHIKLLDMAAACVYVSPDGEETIMATNEILEHFEISREELFKQAQASLKKDGLNIFKPFSGENKTVMYVASNNDYIFGASVILSDEHLKNIKHEIGEDSFYIIPSSIHEVIIVPYSFFNETEREVPGLKEFIGQVNANPDIIDEKDVLTNSLYLCRIADNEDEFVKEFIRL